jgi:TP901 family phage tail tape measure protein
LNNIQLNIVANAQFQQVYAEVAKLKTAMTSLQQTSVGGPFTTSVVSDMKNAQAQFDATVNSTRAFTIQQVAMTDSVNKFGQQLSKGQLSLSNYYKIWRDSAQGASAEIDALATSQARLNRSIAIADPLNPGYAKLVTDINGVVTAEEKAIFQTQALNTALQQGSIKLIDFGKNTQWMGRQLTVGLTMPLAMFGAAASKAYLSFDQQMTDMLKVYGEHAVVQSQQTLNTIETQVTALADKLARTIGASMTDTVTIAKTFSAIGLQGQNLISTTEATVKLQKLGGLAADQAANSMVSLQNVFKLQGNQMSQAIDFLNAAKHSTSTTMQDIVEALPKVGPVIQQLGGSYKDFTAFLVALKESGVPASQGANAIKSMLASIINPTKAATQALDAMHINIKQIVSDNNGSPMGMVKSLSQALDGLPSTEKLQVIEKIFGKQQYVRVAALMGNISNTNSQVSKVLGLYNASDNQLAAVAQQELDIQSKGTPAARFNTMKQSLQADLIPLGKAFLDAFTRIGDVVNSIVNAFRSFSNMLGPAASILGKIFGTGAAGLLVAGPIIMLVGLFSNLIGNILRGANSIRMFRQGLASAAPGENAFLAGLHGMRNFYQELDTSVIAARNQMDLMPEAITSNAKAFEILRNEIVKLTEQFTLLGTAQTDAMNSSSMSALGTALAPMGAKFLPIVKKNLGGLLPGFASGGSIYDPSQHGSVVPGQGNTDTVLARVPVGGFVLNKAGSQRNPGLASLPRFNGGGTMMAMLTPGETVFDPQTTASNYSLLNAANSGASVGGSIMGGKHGYGVSSALSEMEAQLANRIEKFNISRAGKRNALIEAMKTPFLKSSSIKGIASEMYDRFNHPIPKGSVRMPNGSIVTPSGNVILAAVAKPPTGLYAKEAPGLVGESGKPITVEEINGLLANTGLRGQAIDSYVLMLKEYSAAHGASQDIYGSTSHLLDQIYKKAPELLNGVDREAIKTLISNRYLSRLEQMKKDGIALTDNNNPYFAVSDQVIKEFSNSPQTSHLYGIWNDFNKQNSAFNTISMNALEAQRGPTGANAMTIINPLTGKKISIDKMVGNTKTGSMFLHSANSSWLKDYGIAGYAKGGSIGAHHRRSPVYSYTASDVYRGQTKRMKSSLGIHYNSYKAPHTKGLKGWNSGGYIPGYEGGGVTGALSTTASGLGSMWKYGNLKGEAGTGMLSSMSGGMKMGVGTGLSMGAPMAINAIPSQIGGTDIGAAKSALGSAASLAGTAMMFGASGPAGLAIGGAVLAVKALSWWIGKVKKDHQDHLRVVQETYTASTSAINLFNTSLGKTKDQMAIQIAQLKSNDPFKEVANSIKGMNDHDAQEAIKSFASAQVLSGMSADKVKLLTASMLTYAGKASLIPKITDDITSSTKDLGTATGTFVSQLENQTATSDRVAKSYKDLTDGGKNLGNGLMGIINAAANGQVSLDKLGSIMPALSKSIEDPTKAITALNLALDNAGQGTTWDPIITQLRGIMGDSKSLIPLLSMVATLQSKNIDTSFIGNFKSQKDITDFFSSGNFDKFLKAQQSSQNASNAPSASVVNAQNSLALEKQTVTTLTEKKKVLDDTIAAENQRLNTIKQQNDYLNKQTDLTDQIKTAEISGNYIQAAQLTSQQNSNTAQYVDQAKIDAQQSQSDALASQIADLNATMSDQQASLNSISSSTAGTMSEAAITNAEIVALEGLVGKNGGFSAPPTGGTKTAPFDASSLIPYSDLAASPDVGKGNIYNDNGNLKPQAKDYIVRMLGLKPGQSFTYSQAGSDGKKQSLYTADTTGSAKAPAIDFKGTSVPATFGNPPVSTDSSNNKQVVNEPDLIDRNLVKSNKKGFTFTAADGLKYQLTGETDNNDEVWVVKPVKKANGGAIYGPGGPKSDLIPAMLSNGEYVMNAGSVSKYGVGFMNALNSKRYNTGGNVSTAFAKGSDSIASHSSNYNINLTINASGVTDPNQITRMAQDGVMRALQIKDAKINKTNMAVRSK